jgi:cell division protein FtsB
MLQQTVEASEEEKRRLKKENDQLTAQNRDLKNHLVRITTAAGTEHALC